jgi:hypothetical protein
VINFGQTTHLPDLVLLRIAVALTCSGRCILQLTALRILLLIFALVALHSPLLLLLRRSLLGRKLASEELVEEHLVHWYILNLLAPELLRVDISRFVRPSALARDDHA